MDDELQEDWLDARLRDEASYIDDGGFTAQVVHQLPAGQQQSHFVRAAILLGVTLLASLLAYFASGGGRFLANAAAFLVAMPLVTVCVIAGLCAVAVMTISAYAAISKTRELRA